MLANDVKKGMRVQLNNGWYGTMMDNLKGATRMVTVEGIVTETGSVYTHDIRKVLVNGVWEDVELSAKQAAHRSKLKMMGF